MAWGCIPLTVPVIRQFGRPALKPSVELGIGGRVQVSSLCPLEGHKGQWLTWHGCRVKQLQDTHLSLTDITSNCVFLYIIMAGVSLSLLYVTKDPFLLFQLV